MILGIIIRICKDFMNSLISKTLLTSLLLVKLEYNTVVSPSYLKYQIQCFDNVQKRFLHFMAFKCNLTRVQHVPYQVLLKLFDIVGLSKKRKINYVQLLFKLDNGFIDCPLILSFLNFNDPECKTRFTDMFYVFIQRTNYVSASPTNRTMCLANENQVKFIDFTSIETFNNHVNRIVFT